MDGMVKWIGLVLHRGLRTLWKMEMAKGRKIMDMVYLEIMDICGEMSVSRTI
jgi:hypothetical protein